MANKDGQHHDTRYLEKHQNLWRCIVGYRQGGKVIKLRRSLGTASLREAQRLRWRVVSELKAGAHGAQKGAPGRSEEEADAWRAVLAASSGEPHDPVQRALHDHLEALRGDPIVTEEDVDGSPVYIYHPERERQAVEFADRAYGRATPITTHLDAFLASRGELKADTRKRHEAAVRNLSAWLKGEGLPATIQALDRRVAIRYVDQLSPGHPDPQRLSLIWEWLVKREHATSDPWRELQAAPRARVEPERAWTDDEVQALLSGSASPSMRLLMEVGALTGARLDAIIRMEVKGDTIILPPQKKERGPRTIPLHSHLANSLRGWSGWQWSNSGAASAMFVLYRRRVLGPDPPGRRRAVTNFHSWRRWFISKAERAGIDERIISDVVGHARRSMTGRYSAGASMEQKRACVESVRLPT
jgi:integrase